MPAEVASPFRLLSRTSTPEAVLQAQWAGVYLLSFDGAYAAHFTPDALSIYRFASGEVVFNQSLSSYAHKYAWSGRSHRLFVQTGPRKLILVKASRGGFQQTCIERPFAIAAVAWAGDLLCINSSMSLISEVVLDGELVISRPQAVKFAASFNYPAQDYNVVVHKATGSTRIIFFTVNQVGASVQVNNPSICGYSTCPSRLAVVCISPSSIHVVAPHGVRSELTDQPLFSTAVKWLQHGDIAVSSHLAVTLYDFQLLKLRTLGPNVRSEHVYTITGYDTVYFNNPKEFKLINPIIHDQAGFWAVESQQFVLILDTRHKVQVLITWETSAPVVTLTSETLLLVFPTTIYAVWNTRSTPRLVARGQDIVGANTFGNMLYYWTPSTLYTLDLSFVPSVSTSDQSGNTLEYKQRYKINRDSSA